MDKENLLEQLSDNIVSSVKLIKQYEINLKDDPKLTFKNWMGLDWRDLLKQEKTNLLALRFMEKMLGEPSFDMKWVGATEVEYPFEERGTIDRALDTLHKH